MTHFIYLHQGIRLDQVVTVLLLQIIVGPVRGDFWLCIVDFWLWHVHAEYECRATAFPGRFTTDLAACILHELLADVEAQADAFTVHRPTWTMLIQLAKKLKQIVNFCLIDTSAIVYNMYY